MVLAATGLGYLSPYSGYLPQATNQVIEYIRKPGEFALNDYAQYVEAPAPVFTWPYVDPDQPVRIVSDAEFAWEDGAARPSGNANLLSYKWIPGRAFRRSYPWTLGDQSIKFTKNFSGMDPAQQQMGAVASQAMTNRTNRVISLLTTAGNWGSANTADANVLNGGAGLWSAASNDPASSHYLAIKKALLAAVKIINLQTNGRVRFKDLRLLLSPGMAISMADTSEIYSYIEKSPYSLPAQKGDDRNMGQDWGLPPKLYGIDVVVEDAPIVRRYANAAGSVAPLEASGRAYVMPDNLAVLVSRVGGIDGAYGAPSFSTVQIYFVGAQMAAYEFNDTFNQRQSGFIDEQFLEVLAAPAAGFLITNTA